MAVPYRLVCVTSSTKLSPIALASDGAKAHHRPINAPEATNVVGISTLESADRGTSSPKPITTNGSRMPTIVSLAATTL